MASVASQLIEEVTEQGKMTVSRMRERYAQTVLTFLITYVDATECVIALIICSTCFGHLYAHHQELETILVLLPHVVCNALVAGGRLLGAEQQAMRPG